MWIKVTTRDDRILWRQLFYFDEYPLLVSTKSEVRFNVAEADDWLPTHLRDHLLIKVSANTSIVQCLTFCSVSPREINIWTNNVNWLLSVKHFEHKKKIEEIVSWNWNLSWRIFKWKYRRQKRSQKSSRSMSLSYRKNSTQTD